MMRLRFAPSIASMLCVLIGAGLLLAVGLPADAARAAEDEQGFVPIFDGKTLAGWEGDSRFWSVEDGAITGQTTEDNPTEHNTFLIWRQSDVDDFILRFEYKLIGGNSGVQYRSFENPEWEKWVVGGYQADFEAGDRYSGILYGERYRGILADRGQKTVIGPNHKPKVVEQFGDAEGLQEHVKKEEWNEYEISAQGYHFVHKINGQVMSEATDEDTEMRRPSGIVAIQVHRGPPMKIQVRNIRLKRLGAEAKKKIVLIAGEKSHGYGAHEHNAGCLLLAKWLNEAMPCVNAVVRRDGWPEDPSALEGADAICVFADGGERHPVMPHLAEVDKLAKQGVGIAMLHYGVEVPKGKPGDYFVDWIGGYFETDWSVNPHWTAKFEKFPDHPITRGVKPFEIDDEWYYHMRFRENMEGVTPVLSAVPPDSTRERPDGPHSNNPTVRARKGMPEHLAWACERADGGRGFGFTGGHWQWTWANDSFRTLVLNGIAWTAGLEVPPGGVPSQTPTMEALEQDQDYPQPGPDAKRPFERQEWVDLLEQWKQESAKQ
ncbi:MAG TPA: family 16 glycoside hydrolase [Thermoguttaceae bacterium]|nr:family 16 glycoside hydrolase [Thermoguttaceae bacterium]